MVTLPLCPGDRISSLHITHQQRHLIGFLGRILIKEKLAWLEFEFLLRFSLVPFELQLALFANITGYIRFDSASTSFRYTCTLTALYFMSKGFALLREKSPTGIGRGEPESSTDVFASARSG